MVDLHLDAVSHFHLLKKNIFGFFIISYIKSPLCLEQLEIEKKMWKKKVKVFHGKKECSNMPCSRNSNIGKSGNSM